MEQLQFDFSSSITFIDLFAGIGGFHLGMNDVGCKCVFASEIDKNARKTYEENFQRKEPKMFSTGNFAADITAVKISDIPDHDILCGGFPCQPFSNAGHRKGFDDERRGNLFFNVAEIIRVKGPKAFFLENVRGLLTNDNGQTIKTIEKMLKDELGYSLSYKVIKGTEFGVPQLRPRVYLVGFRDKNIKFNFPESQPLTMNMSDIFGGKCSRDTGYTLRCGGGNSKIGDKHNWDNYIVDGKVRRLGIPEAKKMQGLPETFSFPVSNSQARKQLGNSVVVPVIKAIGREIVKHL